MRRAGRAARASGTPSRGPRGERSAVHFVIMGCGRVGLDAWRTAVEERGSQRRRHRPERRRLPPAGTDLRGPAGDRAGLRPRHPASRPGSRTPYAFAAVSNGDNSNILAARVARETFGVENVVARIYDPGRAEVYQRLGIPTVATVRWTADQMLRRLLPAGAPSEFRDASRRACVLAEVQRAQGLGRPAAVRAGGRRRGAGRLPHPAGRGRRPDRRTLCLPGGRPRARRHARRRAARPPASRRPRRGPGGGS